MRMKHGVHFATHGRGVKSCFEEERAVSRNGLVFYDVCISKHQDYGVL